MQAAEDGTGSKTTQSSRSWTYLVGQLLAHLVKQAQLQVCLGCGELKWGTGLVRAQGCSLDIVGEI